MHAQAGWPYRHRMNSDRPSSSLAADQVAALDEHVRAAADRLCDRHPEMAGPVRSRLDALRGRIRLAHARCARVEAEAWAQHRAELDRGLAELDVELDRARQGGPAGGPSLDTVLLGTAASLELRAWRLYLDTTFAADAPAHELAADVERNVSRLRAADRMADGAAAARMQVEESLEALRRKAEGAGPQARSAQAAASPDLTSL